MTRQINNKDKKEWRDNKNRVIVILALLGGMITFSNNVQTQSLYQATGYLLQKVDTVPYSFRINFKHGLFLPFFQGYYIVNEKTLISFLKHDSVNYEQATLLCDPASRMFADSAITREVQRSTRIKDILELDDSEIYKIGNEIYIVRKIRYAYYDNSQVKVYIKGTSYYWWDDISDEDTVALYATYEVGQLYNRDYYQCYHHLIELIKTPQNIRKRIWKRLYEIGKDYPYWQTVHRRLKMDEAKGDK